MELAETVVTTVTKGSAHTEIALIIVQIATATTHAISGNFSQANTKTPTAETSTYRNQGKDMPENKMKQSTLSRPKVEAN